MFKLARIVSCRVANVAKCNLASRTFSTHGQIFMKATKAPVPNPDLDMEAIQKRVDEMDYNTLERSSMRSEENYFDETDPLSADMLELEPMETEGTIIWLLGLGDTHQKCKPLFELLRTHKVRWVIPNPPSLPLTALNDACERSWYDVMSNTYKEEDEEDYTGIKVSMMRVQELINEEADRLGKQYAPADVTDPVEIRKIGAQRVVLGGFGQGAALSLFTGIRYPHKLCAMVSFSGYFPHINETADALTAALKQANESSETTSTDADTDSTRPSPPKAALSPPNLSTPSLVVHGQHDDAMPWESFAKPRYLRAMSPPLNMNFEVRPSFEMGHFMGTQEMLNMHHWMVGQIQAANKSQKRQ